MELRTEQSPCVLKSVLKAAHQAILFRKASLVMLVIAVTSQSLLVRAAEVCIQDNLLRINKLVEFTLTKSRESTIDQIEADEFLYQLSQWLIDAEPFSPNT